MSGLRRVVLAGGAGFVGRALIREFVDAGYEVVVLSRSGKAVEGTTVARWDGANLGDWVSYLDGASAVVNLAGEPVTLRWTDENKRKILESRVESTALIGKAIRGCGTPPQVWVNASAVGYYGDTGDTQMDEASPAGEGFLAETCLAWERAQEEAETPSTRKARVRIGFVLGRDGGAFPELAKLTKRFLGGAQGSGRQWIPWIDVRDLARLFRWVVEGETKGALNGVGPSPVRNGELMEAMRKAGHRPWSPPAPGFAIKLAGAFMGMQTDVALVSQRAVPTTALASGFAFEHTDLDAVLAELFASRE